MEGNITTTLSYCLTNQQYSLMLSSQNCCWYKNKNIMKIYSFPEEFGWSNHRKIIWYTRSKSLNVIWVITKTLNFNIVHSNLATATNKDPYINTNFSNLIFDDQILYSVIWLTKKFQSSIFAVMSFCYSKALRNLCSIEEL